MSSPSKAAPGGMVTLFPHVRLDKGAGVVEFDGTVAVDCHDPQTPVVYLELVCCTPDTREHESLVVTSARPSHIHAALLAAGLSPGRPGLVDFRGREVVGRPPEGDAAGVEIAWRDAAGAAHAATPSDWIVSLADHRRLAALPEGPGVWGRAGGWVFAGSQVVARRDPETGQVRDVYDADGGGQVIGLTTFGSETIAWRQVLSPESAISAPVWIADIRRVPPRGTPVVVRLRAEREGLITPPIPDPVR